MKRALVDDLVCPSRSIPSLVEGAERPDDVETGELVCTGCERRWPIRAGIPRLVPPDLVEQQRRPRRHSAGSGSTSSRCTPSSRRSSSTGSTRSSPSSSADKRVLDAGCGTGRHAYFAASYGASEVVALDLSGAVETARRNLASVRQRPRRPGRPPAAAVPNGRAGRRLRLRLLDRRAAPPPRPARGFRTLVEYVRPGGTIAVWVYGHENNGFVRNVVEPLRRVSTRVPPPVLRGLAWPLAARIPRRGERRVPPAPRHGRRRKRSRSTST